MATNLYDSSTYPVLQLYDNTTLSARSVDDYYSGDKYVTGLSQQHKAVGVKYFPVEAGKTYLIRSVNKPSILGADGSTVYTYDCINTIWFNRASFKNTSTNITCYEIECAYTRNAYYYGETVASNTSYTGDRDILETRYMETDYTNRVLIRDYNDSTSTNAPSSKGATILSNATDGVYVTIISSDIKYMSFNIEPNEFPYHGITSLIDTPSSSTVTYEDESVTLFSSIQGGLSIEEVEVTAAATTYVKGDDVENATEYELCELVDGTYNTLATAEEINFEVSALGLAAGDHTLVVKAKADGYTDSDYSNEVVYTAE